MGYVTFVDETTTGERETGPRLEVAQERLTVRELIGRRVREEIAAGRRRRKDPEGQTELVLKAFAANGFLLLVGERQLTELDEEVDLTADTEVTFLKLIPLVGG
ncbi:hypothetical protein [Streptomyces cupreus]|uniref:MoaD/ThiS family protein n=1 Tax=Streptomyces cupreus TaxID=2759956 RepID=A0A7X1J0Q8_9ACTN|nr:hypothetical protein [Streptomyces cupreus]MBC2901415.1 hypothetical protein [Streptomyces cupreus]